MRLHVAVLDDYDLLRGTLGADPRLRILGPGATRYDVRVLDPLGARPPELVREMLADDVPTVVRTAGADARAVVAAWAAGANDVVTKVLGASHLADTLCTAVSHPFHLGAGLAEAIVEVTGRAGPGVESRLGEVLGQVRRGRRLTAAMQQAGLTPAEYEAEIRTLRDTLRGAGLDLRPAPPTPRQREALVLYAEGRSLPEIQQQLGVGPRTLAELLGPIPDRLRAELRALNRARTPDRP
ncbi:hypothetical protein Aab01nite_36630 [Paractinoplanes abujensis]|uniref:DNA-binding NarL/FixJ family response regulator n=1 Tax=Paractinoplanes abujensis TaxID=882441 RepID=A0A7W7CWF2_9ACTN|nr:hypothetical protein [Actinoplanes abujensis]MBB4694715.1 DNA-binding NarL/FixJ family response regulator [Actinoplanes abujensis]GID20073.1 hypothetical protein Aab01nite_36630 [Actinoplanes abujensis]